MQESTSLSLVRIYYQNTWKKSVFVICSFLFELFTHLFPGTVCQIPHHLVMNFPVFLLQTLRLLMFFDFHGCQFHGDVFLGFII